ncbi:DUF4339 domain-containing protein [Lignipirellula cremea]|uniref:GYF domain-containing protein n=1 Tax=Lignipirellula cremea TaxID=2528010 RepID=A0A518E2X7_9BACT|nr:DUF4339 domain-containing protein [Lignipirellula cremea]QDU98437.1 hypothetical protein Pla8534_63050 [Lignipirellula cremea]
MADNVWYYAQGDEEKGPVTTADLKSMAAAGKLKPDDLVWKEGMPDWSAASTVRGLFAHPPGSRPSPPPSWSGAPAARSSEENLSDSGGPPPTRPTNLLADLARHCPPRLAGRVLLFCGLLLVLWAKGCDSLGRRYVARVQARPVLEENEFERTYAVRLSALRSDRDIYLETDAGERDPKVLTRIEDDIEKLTEKKQEEEEQLERGEWGRLKAIAADAANNNAVSAYYREMAFLFGSMVLVCGLLGVAFTSDGAERWISYIMLAIITFSLYIGGAAFLHLP